MTRTIVLGLDPGLATCGLALVELLPIGERLVALEVFRSEKSAKKLNVLDAADSLRRARELMRWIARCCVVAGGDVRLIAAERFSAPRNAGAAAKIGWAWGIIAGIAEAKGLPVVQPSPQEIKLAVCGRKDASKDAVEESMRARLAWYDHVTVDEFTDRYPASVHEHAWDALAAIVASLDSDVVRAIRPRGDE